MEEISGNDSAEFGLSSLLSGTGIIKSQLKDHPAWIAADPDILRIFPGIGSITVFENSGTL
jgi:hypothetical protein